jgi:hypothetical protein
MRNSDSSTSGLGPERPFPGLRPYGFADHEYFFGRQEQVFALYRLLDRSRFTAVVGTSGSGKSSLVRAGLLPLLQEETDEGRARRWKWFQIRPGNTPIARLANALGGRRPDAPEEPERAIHRIRRSTIEVLLRRSSFGLRESVRQLQEFDDHAILIVVDQFEEIFRYAELGEGEQEDALVRESRRQEAEAFVQLLLEATRDPNRAIHVMATMRSDYLGDCARFYGLPEAVAASQFLVPSLTRDQREEAICGPIELVGARIDGELVQRLLNDGGGANDHLPALQHALMRTWDEAGRRQSAASQAGADAAAGTRRLTSAHYEAIGTLSRALSQHADELMTELHDLEPAVEAIFRALAELDREGRAIRRPLPFDRLLVETGVPEADLRRVLDRFRRDDCSFLVPSFPFPLAGDTVIDIGHEALIRRWDRIAGNAATGGAGWLWREAEDGNIYRGLAALAGDQSAGAASTLPLEQVDSRWRWWTSRARTAAWAARYGGHLDSVQRLFENSLAALQARRERRRRTELERRRRFRRAVTVAAGSVMLAILALIAMGWAWREKSRADHAVVREKASSVWSRLTLQRDPLPSTDVDGLWKLAQADEQVRVASVDMLGEEQALLQKFGRNPLPFARAVGLRWPRDARDKAVGAVKYVASDKFKASDDIAPFELIAYARAVAFLTRTDGVRLSDSDGADVAGATGEQARENIGWAIKQLTSKPNPGAREIQALAEIVDVVGGWVKPETLDAARRFLRDWIAQAEAKKDKLEVRGDRALSRAIEVLAPSLSEQERHKAFAYLLTRLSKQDDGRSQQAVPRAVNVLVKLHAGGPSELSAALPEAIAVSAARRPRGDSAYLVAMMQITETAGDKLGEADAAKLAHGFAQRLAHTKTLPERAALARATMPLLRPASSSVPAVLDQVTQATFGERAPEEIGAVKDALMRALGSSGADAGSRTPAAEAAVSGILQVWVDYPARKEAYLSAAQLRLLATLAPMLGDAMATQATRNLLVAFWRPGADPSRAKPAAEPPAGSYKCAEERRALQDDYLVREAAARALQALAPRLAPRTPEREMGLCMAKMGLAWTGSREEATAWARAVAALLPPDRADFTSGIVEILKYPTAAGAPTELLLAELAKRWPDEAALGGKKGLDLAVLGWLERQPGRLLEKGVAPPLSPEAVNATAGG